MSAKVITKTLLTFFILAFAYSAMAAPAPAKANGPRSLRDEMVLTVDSNNKSSADLIRLVSGLSYLIKNQNTDAGKEDLLISRAAAALALSRNFRLAKVHDEKTKASEAKYSQMAKDDAEHVLRMDHPKQANKSAALYYDGLAKSNMGDIDGAQKSFLDAIQQDPKAEHAPIMSLLVAETSFDKELYKDAIAQYRMFYNRLTDIQKVIAIYKTAWCQVNLREWESAEKNFLRLVVNRKSKEFGNDSKRDLAFVLTQHLDEANILAYTAPEFKTQPGLRTEILTLVYKMYLAQSGTRNHPMLFSELMRIETDPAKRLSLIIDNLRAHQREYAAEEPYKEYTVLRDRMKQMGVTPESQVFAKIAPELEPEIKTMIASYSDTFFDQGKSPENLTHEVMGKRLIELLTFHSQFFPKSPDRATSFEAWMNVCAKMKDYQCQYDVARKVLGDDSLKKMRRRALLQIIGALDEMQAKDAKLQPEFLEYLRIFSEEMPKDPEWLRVTKRYTAILGEQKKYEVAIPILQKIDLTEKNSESRFRLIWAYFQAGMFDKVTAFTGPFADDKFGKDSQEYVREAHLRVADQEIGKNDFDDYEKNVQGYLASNPDEKKRDLVERDYLNRLIDHKSGDRVQESLIKMPVQKRFFGTFAGVTNRLVDDHIKYGRFALAMAILQHPASTPIPPNSEADRYQAEIGMGGSFGKAQLTKISLMPQKIRQYFFGVLALTRPEAMIEFFRSSPTVKSQDRAVYLLALQVKADRWDIDLDAKTLAALGSVVPVELRQTGITTAETRAKRVQFPSEHASAQRRTKMLQEAAGTTRQLRKQFEKDLVGKMPRVQLRILQAGIDLEDKMAQLITDSPVPAGLSDEQVKEYQDGIAELAKEFKTQSEEYQKLRSSIEEKENTNNAENKDIEAFTLSKWKKAKVEAAGPIEELVGAGNFAGALLALDRWKQTGGISDADYYSLRVYILMIEHNGSFTKQYVYHELVAAKQDELAARWRESH